MLDVSPKDVAVSSPELGEVDGFDDACARRQDGRKYRSKFVLSHREIAAAESYVNRPRSRNEQPDACQHEPDGKRSRSGSAVKDGVCDLGSSRSAAAAESDSHANWRSLNLCTAVQV